jgi:hypothetical protein
MASAPRTTTATAIAVADDAMRDRVGWIRERPVAASASVSSDPIDELVERVRPVAAKAVDVLQVAASLESDGITDALARDKYGQADVFALAEEVRRRAGSAESKAASASGPPWRWAAAVPDLAHGLLYLMPAAVFPAALAVLGRQSLVLGLVLAGGIGWVWAGGATWLAYRLLGQGHAGSAARVLRWSTVAGLPVAAATSVVVVATTGAGYGLIAMAVAQMSYQMASALLMFYRREVLLFLAMLPAALAGLGYLAIGRGVLPLTIAAGIGSVAVVFGLALRQTKDQGEGREPPLRDGLRGEIGQLPAVLIYTSLAAAYLLHFQAPYMLERSDIVVAAVPLIVGMGVVEWRARCFGEQARALLSRVRYPWQFVARVWLLLARDIGICTGTVALLGAAMLAALRAWDLLTAPGAMMTVAGALLAGAYFTSFLLVGMARYGWLSGSLAACIAMHLAVVRAAGGELSPLADTTVITSSALLLLLLFLAALAGPVRQARHHR